MDIAGTISLLFAYFVVPTILAVLFTRAGPSEIVHAYLVWVVILLCLGMAMGNTLDEKLGWPLIMAIFFTTPSIPVLTAVLRSTGLHLP